MVMLLHELVWLSRHLSQTISSTISNRYPSIGEDSGVVANCSDVPGRERLKAASVSANPGRRDDDDGCAIFSLAH
jgi:hypothetical protein